MAQASKAFGALRKAVFLDKDLKLATKKRVYSACPLSPPVSSRVLDSTQAT